MPELSIQNIDRIARDIKRQEIIFSHLADDLIDHICCDVEYEMEKGLTFYEAYTRVKQKFGKRRLKEIQEEALYATDTKYRFMKNTMKFSGVAGTILFGCAAMFKIQHWPGAGIMLTLGTDPGIYLYAIGLEFCGKKPTAKKVVLSFPHFPAGFFITGFYSRSSTGTEVLFL
jgi:hypothetical protein